MAGSVEFFSASSALLARGNAMRRVHSPEINERARQVVRQYQIWGKIILAIGMPQFFLQPVIAGLLVATFGLAIAFQTLVGLLAAVVCLLWSLIQTRLEDRRLIVILGNQVRCFITAVQRYILQLKTGYTEEER